MPSKLSDEEKEEYNKLIEFKSKKLDEIQELVKKIKNSQAHMKGWENEQKALDMARKTIDSIQEKMIEIEKRM